MTTETAAGMEPEETPGVELPEDEHMPIRLGVDLAPEDATPPDDDEPDVDPAPGLALRANVGRAEVHEPFTDGTYYGQPTDMQVKPKIMTEDGRTFLRITGSSGDKHAIPAAFPARTRSTIWFTSHFRAMPLLAPHNLKQTYRADLRIGPTCPNGCSVFEMFQDAPEGTGAYGSQNGSGPSARFIVVNGRMKFETRYNNEHKVDVYDLGVAADQWHTYELVAVWSHAPRVGRFDVSVDGRHRHTIRGRDVNMGPTTHRLPAVKFGLYGDHVTGHCDVTNIHCFPTGGYVPGEPITPPIVPIPPIPERQTRAVTCGAKIPYTATDGTPYALDRAYQGGRTELMRNPISGTEDEPLYQSWRYGNCRYQAPCQNGTYLITLHFAEHLHTEPGQRVFDVVIEGQPVLTHLDVVARVGPKAAYVVEIPVTVTDGALTVGFESVIGNAMVSAIKVEPV